MTDENAPATKAELAKSLTLTRELGLRVIAVCGYILTNNEAKSEKASKDYADLDNRILALINSLSASDG